MTDLKKTGLAEAVAQEHAAQDHAARMQTAPERTAKRGRPSRVKKTLLPSGEILTTELLDVSPFKGSSKYGFDDETVPAFGKCYRSLLKQYFKEHKVSAVIAGKMRDIARVVFANLHDLKLHQIRASTVEDCLDLHAKSSRMRKMAIDTFNAVITTAFEKNIIRKTQDVFFYEYALVVADPDHFTIGKDAECSIFKRLCQRYRSQMDLEARQSVERIFENLRSLKTTMRYAANKPLVGKIAEDFVIFMRESGLYKPCHSSKERKLLTGALVTDTLMMASPRLDLLYIGNAIAGTSRSAEKAFASEGIDG